ncbi:hypothetical protein WBG78_22525 [Chryseolinea sp. T2]|uniref:hypothetical protein n=1 Tax=Chryseolinea sp. T2 TaxID=3129255 RepID=UPI0030778968
MNFIITPFRLSEEAWNSTYDEEPLWYKWMEFEGGISIAGQEITVAFRIAVDFVSGEPCAVLFRPVDFIEAKDWVLDTTMLPMNDKTALLDLLNVMEDDDRLYLHFGC